MGWQRASFISLNLTTHLLGARSRGKWPPSEIPNMIARSPKLTIKTEAPKRIRSAEQERLSPWPENNAGNQGHVPRPVSRTARSMRHRIRPPLAAMTEPLSNVPSRQQSFRFLRFKNKNRYQTILRSAGKPIVPDLRETPPAKEAFATHQSAPRPAVESADEIFAENTAQPKPHDPKNTANRRFGETSGRPAPCAKPRINLMKAIRFMVCSLAVGPGLVKEILKFLSGFSFIQPLINAATTSGKLRSNDATIHRSLPPSTWPPIGRSKSWHQRSRLHTKFEIPATELGAASSG